MLAMQTAVLVLLPPDLLVHGLLPLVLLRLSDPLQTDDHQVGERLGPQEEMGLEVGRRGVVAAVPGETVDRESAVGAVLPLPVLQLPLDLDVEYVAAQVLPQEQLDHLLFE